MLFRSYDTGQGVPQDYEEAVKWYSRAAEKGHAYAQHNLGVMYATGQGVAKDYIEAHKWLNLAAAQGNKEAREKRDAIDREMTSDQISQAQQLAREWIEKHGQ